MNWPGGDHLRIAELIISLMASTGLIFKPFIQLYYAFNYLKRKASGGDNIRVVGNIEGNTAIGNIEGNAAGSGRYLAGSETIKIEDKYGMDTAEALGCRLYHRVADYIKRSNKKDAEILFDIFMEELQKPEPDKVRLRKLWEGIGKLLPAVNSIAGVAAKILPLFMQ